MPIMPIGNKFAEQLPLGKREKIAEKRMDRFLHGTKILCTFGPAIASKEKIISLVEHGATAFRLNMSHGSHETHLEAISIIRAAEEELGCPLPIVVDIQGPKLRVGDLPDGTFSLMNGREVFIADESAWIKLKKPAHIIPVRYPTIAKDVDPGTAILFDDGILKVEVLETDGTIIKAIVVHGGLLKSRKGINVPNARFSEQSVTPKDKEDIIFAIKHKCDYVAVSFVRTAHEMISVRNFIAKHGGDLWVIAKIEKPEAVANAMEIIEASHAVMIARGDLGVEIPAAQVPIVQKRIIEMCNRHSKPVITATQMLESMIHNPRPTRAEASDVANAVLDGTDVVMLSAETSVGAFPIETVSYMRRICQETERALLRQKIETSTVQPHVVNDENVDLIARAVAMMSGETTISGIACLSISGRTVRYISSRRPSAPIISVTDDIHAARRVNLLNNVLSLLVPRKPETTDEMVDIIKIELVRRGYFRAGTDVIVTIGRPLIIGKRTNMISIERLENLKKEKIAMLDQMYQKHTETASVHTEEQKNEEKKAQRTAKKI